MSNKNLLSVIAVLILIFIAIAVIMQEPGQVQNETDKVNTVQQPTSEKPAEVNMPRHETQQVNIPMHSREQEPMQRSLPLH